MSGASPGLTASEQYLNRLATKTFLNLWSYPNLYIGKDLRGGSSGKELCDLLIICGDHVIIFSDKHIEWPTGASDVAWNRWVKRSVLKSADQVRGARRWISEHPDRIYVDAACKQKLPLPLPPPERMKVHGIVVARGAKAASISHFKGGSGSLAVMPSIKGNDHLISAETNGKSFTIGDVDPNGPFIHVFDEVTLDIALGELDTIGDFTDYLERKSDFLRSGKLQFAAGEENLIAHYITKMNNAGRHDFVNEDGSNFRAEDKVIFEDGAYHSLRENPQYEERKKADRISYVWDRLIENFTDHMIAGTSVSLDGEAMDIVDQEQGVRYMALVQRVERRAHGRAVIGALDKSVEGIRFCRAMIPLDRRTDTGFFFATLAVPTDDILPGGYEAYRLARRNLLQAYALGYLERHRFLKRIIGIGTEPKNAEMGSQDLIFALPAEWTEEEVGEIRATCKRLGIMDQAVSTETRFSETEWPEITSATPEVLRQTKRQARRAAGKHKAPTRY
jgi:hypothetical protein